jgi:hypothetical protein
MYMFFAFAWEAGAHSNDDQDPIRLLIHHFAAGSERAASRKSGQRTQPTGGALAAKRVYAGM